MTVSGSTLAIDPDSDFALLQINQSMPSSWNRVYAGWDRSGQVPDYSVSIHHPSGDVMKVSRDNHTWKNKLFKSIICLGNTFSI